MINVTKTGRQLLQNDITYPADRRGSPAMRINPGETDTIYDNFRLVAVGLRA